MKKLLISLFLSFLVAIPVFGQTSQNFRNSPEFDSHYQAYLDDTIKDIDKVSYKGARILFRARIANLLERFDRERSKLIMTSAQREFLRWLRENETLINSDPVLVEGKSNEDFYFERGKLPKNGGDFFKKYEIVDIREKFILEIAYLDAFEAYEFYKKTNEVLAVEELLYLWRNENLSPQIFRLMMSQDPGRGIENAREYISDKDNSDSLEVVKVIYDIDPPSGGKLGDRYLEDWIKRNLITESDFSKTAGFLSSGKRYLIESESKKSTFPMFSRELLAKAAEKFATALLGNEKTNEYSDYQLKDYLESIGYFLPEKAKVLQDKRKEANEAENCPCAKKEADSSVPRLSAPDDKMIEAMKKAAEKISKSAESAKFGEEPDAEVDLPDDEKARILKRKKDMDFVKSLSELNERNLSDDERPIFVTYARIVIAGVKDKNKRVWLLTELAFNLDQPSDKEVAMKIMSEAAKLVDPNPVSFFDMFYSARMVSGYSSFEIENSFSGLEQIVTGLNKTANAGLQVTEILGGELPIMGDLPVAISDEVGESAFRTVGNADGTIARLASADFARLRKLQDRIDDPKMKIAFNLLILKSLHRSYYSKGDKDK